MSSSSHSGRSGISSIWQDDKTVDFRDEARVSATTIDNLLKNETDRCGLIKLDLEGGDFMALLGAITTLRQDRPLVVFENSNRAPDIYGYDIEQVESFLRTVGYAAIGFNGEVAKKENWFAFWEMWAAPIEEAEALQSRLKTVVQGIINQN